MVILSLANEQSLSVKTNSIRIDGEIYSKRRFPTYQSSRFVLLFLPNSSTESLRMRVD